MSVLYNLCFTFFLILYFPYALLKGLFQKRPPGLLAERFGWVPNLQNTRPVWIHAASVGEVICSIPLFKKMKEEFPEIPIVLSSMTQAGNSTAKTLIPDADRIFFFPFDHPFTIRKAVERVKPRLLLIAETELWPNLLRLCGDKGIPILLFNGRISEKSLKGYLYLKSLFEQCLRHVSSFLMQTEEDRNRVIMIGACPDHTKVMGNMKFDQTFPSVPPEEREAMARSLGLRGEETLFIAGSTHAGEEEVLVKVFKKLKIDAPNLFLLLAPRHLDRLEQVEEILRRESLAWMRRAALSSDTERTRTSENRSSVILLDTLGELMRLYSLGTIVFIGGSLVPVGGHNPLEPLAFKKPVLFGPDMFHFSEISKKLVQERGAIQVKGEEDLLEQLTHLLADERARRELGERGYQFVLRHRGGNRTDISRSSAFSGRENEMMTFDLWDWRRKGSESRPSDHPMTENTLW